MHGSPEDMARGRKGAILSGVVLAAMAVGIYLVVLLKFFAQG
jgi:hypothetical protein